MGSLADVTLGDIGRALARYRPVAITVAIILVVLAVLPGPRRAALGSLGAVPPPAAAATSSDVAAGEAPADASADTTVAPSDSSSSTFDSSSSSSTFDSSSSSSSSDFSSDESSFSSTDAPKPTTDFSDDGFATPGSSSSSDLEPLSIVSAGWASTAGGTPLGSTGVTAGTLPVGKRIGQVDKYSYVRLSGEEKVLTLALADAGRTTTGVVGVSICQITEAGWAEGENVPSDAAPDYDTSTCVPGDPGDGSAWTFNLVTFSSPTDARGFALVPTGDSIDYQVNFKRTA